MTTTTTTDAAATTGGATTTVGAPAAGGAPATDAAATTGGAPATGRLRIAGHDVLRVGFGAARLTLGDGWGRPSDTAAARRVLRAAVDAGITYVDTADSLGPGVSESIIGEELRAHEDVLVATKVGMLRPGPDSWGVLGHPGYLRQQVHNSLHRLRRDRIDLLYLHRIDPAYPLADQLGALQELRDAGHVGHLGVSEPSPAQLEEVLVLEPRLAAVQSLYNLVSRDNAALAARLGDLGVPFVAYWPLVGRGLPAERRAALFARLDALAAPLGLGAAQLALAWLFTTQPGAAAVVGSRSTTHLAQNAAASAVVLDDATLAAVEAAVGEDLGRTTLDPRRPWEDS